METGRQTEIQTDALDRSMDLMMWLIEREGGEMIRNQHVMRYERWNYLEVIKLDSSLY